MIFVNKEYIEKSDNSKWIRIDLPATVWTWKGVFFYIKYLERIKTNTGKIIWRYSTNGTEWLINVFEYKHCEELYTTYKKEQREKKLERITKDEN